ncbi:uncharacterized protein LOC121733984 isoform X2 [Aricia agestis]|nr:uncharacterized protein LOC121733984 isoform X2 [Aricia agestis]
MKFLYLYDPVACGRVESYNFTSTAVNRTTMSSIIWPAKNVVAAGFRWKLKFSLTLHMLWLSLGLASALYGRHLLGLYLTVLPFTAAGAALLVSDIYIVITYLMDIPYTSTEESIIKYIGAGEEYLGELPPALSADDTDTSWVPLLFAYMSSRAVVLWIINYWLVLDNFTEGLAAHRAIKKAAMEPKRRRRERQYR